ncbi:MAG: hypothetical protein IKP50_01635 [Bacilli bacterium]|nr:hypothetical protein [Bacilli bacterium]
MGSKVGFLLSLLLVVELFVLAGDVFSAQIIYTNLDAVSITAGNVISTKGEITDELRNYVRSETGGEITPVGNDTPMFGFVYTFKISKEFNPMNRFTSKTEIAVVRSVVIGYYN